MSNRIIDLCSFYNSPLGQSVERLLGARVHEFWPSVRGERIVGFGFPVPILRLWRAVSHVTAFMPRELGAVYWPRDEANAVALADFSALPLEDDSLSHVVALHALENVRDPAAFLREVWRVLQGNGRAILIVPHRRGFWAENDSTPFGAGQPFSLRQLRALLREEGFVIERIGGALYLPPLSSHLALALAPQVEKIGAPLCPAFGGVLVAEVSKQLYAPILCEERTHKRRIVMPMIPAHG